MSRVKCRVGSIIQTLQDFGFSEGETEIWYLREEFCEYVPAIFNHDKTFDFIDLADLDKTHVLLGKVGEKDPVKIFSAFNAWQPNYEFLRSRGICSSMKAMGIGDIVKIDDKVLVASVSGFIEKEQL